MEKRMATTWVLVAHGSAAKILRVEKNGNQIATIKEFSHPNTAKRDQDIHTDRQGRTFESAGPMRHAMDYGDEPKDYERKVFAKDIVAFIEQKLAQHSFDKIIIVSSPNLLGALRAEFTDNIKSKITHELDKDLLSQNFNEKELIEKVKSDLDLVAI